jgi:hypothetical protein
MSFCKSFRWHDHVQYRASVGAVPANHRLPGPHRRVVQPRPQSDQRQRRVALGRNDRHR